MKFLVDAQLPLRLARWLEGAGFNTRHTLDLPLGNRTPDDEVIACAARESRVVVTKDADFVQYFVLYREPRLLLVATGNLANAELLHLFQSNIRPIVAAFASANFVEISRDRLIVHD